MAFLIPYCNAEGHLSSRPTHDVGIVYAKSDPIVMSFFTMGNTGVYAETEDRMGQIARLIVEYFDGANNPR